MTEFDFDKDKYLDELKSKEFFTVHDSDYHGDVSERAVITQSEKGVFAGVVETKTEWRNTSLTTFFRVSFPDKTYDIWNSKKQPLKRTSQNLNRVFRNEDIIENMDDDNLLYLKNIGNAFKDIAYRKRGYYDNRLLTISDGILESLKTPNSELIYSIAEIMSEEENHGYSLRRSVETIKRYIKILEMNNVKITYKNILKYMGYTKADMQNEDLQKSGFLLEYVVNDEAARENDVDFNYAINKVTQHAHWWNSPRALKESIEYMQKYAEDYGYTNEFSELLSQLSEGSGISSFRRACHVLSSYDNHVNLEKLIKYIYIDVYQHQGFQRLGTAFSTYADYIQLVGEIKGFVVYPKYLAVAHDIAAKAMKSSEQHDKTIAKITDKFTNIEGVYKVRDEGKLVEYPLVLLRSGTEIQKEATSQSNCLAGYINNVARGEDLILSLKNPDGYAKDKKDSLHHSYISIELKRNKDDESLELRQSYATYNSKISNKVVAVLKGIFSKNNIKVPNDIIGFNGLDDIDKLEVVSKSELNTNIVHKQVNKLLNDGDENKEEINSYLARL